MTDTLCPTCGFRNPSGARACASCGTPLATTGLAAHVLPPGTKLQGGAYTVGKVLGQGGFGITYLGSEVAHARAVAVKELFPYGSLRQEKSVLPGGDWSPTAFSEAKQRFGEEARTLRRFHHPNIVQVFAVFDENGTSYMVMEFLRGKSLAGILEERGGPLDEAEATGYIRQIGEALAVVHGAGLLHRDIKPDNVIVTEAGRTVLLDFGTAREFAAGRTHRMTAMLTPGYAPLEQYSQQARFGTFTDVYTLAATLYHLLSGELPVAALDRIQGVELPLVRKLNPKVSAATEQAVMQGLPMEVAKRPQTVQELLSLLGTPPSGAGMTPEAKPPSATAPRPAPPRGAEAASVPAPAPRPAVPDPSREQPPSRPLRRPTHEATLTGHSKWVNTVAFSPNGALLASGGFDNTILVWETISHRQQAQLHGHAGPLLGTLGAIFSVAFSPDGQTLASGGNDDTVRFWDPIRGRENRTLETAGGNVNALAYSPDGELLAIGGQFARTELWDVWQGRSLRVLGGHSLSVVAVGLSPDGHLLATGSEDGTAMLWQLPSGKAVGTLSEHRGAVRAVAFSPDGATLATASDDFTVHLWDLRRGLLSTVLAEHGGGVRCLAFSPDGRLLASGGDDLTVKLWDLQRGALWYTLSGHYGSITSVAFSPGGALLASGSLDQTIQLWRLR